MSQTTTHLDVDGAVRWRWRVTGQVQGVGFRPAAYRWAVKQGLVGHVFNDAHGVVIEAQGSAARLDIFETELALHLPRLARIASMVRKPVRLKSDEAFVITGSRASVCADAAVTVDTSVCDACLAEMRDPTDRRHGHALINCTDCGPRFSIIEAVPYDRPNTTMKAFAMCGRCREEYEDPADRRFHAQPVCCHDCGPKVTVVDGRGELLADGSADSMREAAARLWGGEVVAIKGVGGFHLAVRVQDAAAVGRLRARKHRDSKPLALMVRDVSAARALVSLSEAGEAALRSPAAPIVLGVRREDAGVTAGVAPGTHRLGVMLPYTPMHHLLFEAGLKTEQDLGPLVMTSGNRSDEPLVTDNGEALRRLGEIADVFVMHDRAIARGVDDSIFLDMAQGLPVPMRRSRGLVPGAITLSHACESRENRGAFSGPLPGVLPGVGLCVGGELKTTVAVVRGGEAVLGQHLGDLKHPLAYEHFQRSVDDMLGLFEVHPGWVACDEHPAYLSHAFSARWSAYHGVPLVQVQHHHAHAAALLAEHGMPGPMLALVADGVGYGDGGEVWGGELLLADRRSFRRVARLRPLRLPGGDASSRDTRRCALALLYQAFGDSGLGHPLVDRLGLDEAQREGLSAMLRRDVRCVQSSALGRVFDGVASLLGLCHTNRFEAEAPMAVEAAAHAWRQEEKSDGNFFELKAGDPRTLDLSALIRRLADGVIQGEPTASLAALFQRGLVGAFASLVERASHETGVKTIGLTGGVFANEALTRGLARRLQAEGYDVWRHAQVPPNDGGLCLGQAAVALAQQRKEG